MKTLLRLIVCLMLLVTLSCSGDDPLDQDTEAPTQPTLRPHLGDTGDQLVTWNGQNITLNDDTNGIDTVSDGNFIRIPWEPFIDTDLSHVKVFRFSNHDANPVEIAASVPSSERYYLDTDNQLQERVWYSYFIHLYDSNGNYSVSDTVSYALLSKCLLDYPANNEIVPLFNLKLRWTSDGVNASSFRLLMWNEENELIHHQDVYIDIPEDVYEIPVPANLNVSSGDVIRWRVDAFDDEFGYEIKLGSESSERIFIIQ